VDHADQLAAAVFDFDVDVRRAGVEGILDQLLHNRRRPLDDFAGGDAVNEIWRELVNGPAIHRTAIIESWVGDETRGRSVASRCSEPAWGEMKRAVFRGIWRHRT